MYVKIVDNYGNLETLVETTEVSHKDIDIGQFPPGKFDVVDASLSERATVVEFVGAAWENADSEHKFKTAIILFFPRSDGHERAIVTLGCGIYVMGNDGQTVDVIRY